MLALPYKAQPSPFHFNKDLYATLGVKPPAARDLMQRIAPVVNDRLKSAPK